MNNKQLLLGEVADKLAIKPYRITYAISNGLVSDVQRVGNRRIFSDKDLRRLAKHFGIELEINNTEGNQQ